MTLSRRAKQMESGQALLLVIVALSLFVLGALGLAIDGAQLYAQRQMAQGAADAAAQAGIMSIFDGTNATAPHPFGTGSPPSSFTCTTTDGRTPCVYAALNGFGGTADDTVTITFPTTLTGVTLSAAAAVPAISVTVQRNVKGGLIQMLGPSVTVIKATATAGMSGTVPTTCIYVLDPSASSAFSVTGGATVTMNCGIQVGSSSASGGIVSGGANLTASSIQGNFQVSGGASASPAPTPLTSTIVDPFASLPAPPISLPCDAGHTNFTAGYGTHTLSQGTYCGGITLNGGGQTRSIPGSMSLTGARSTSVMA